ncbi:MAG: hypothetical protein CVV51_10305 [Spirochaetae bacterium HGW-Spirochaetae-7]|nr:MAG: hypothetical protein CVV51_10305 [Spirochaetae bacterium HGW-Spirochaetae-7]
MADLCSALRLPADGNSLVVLSAMLGERLPLDAGNAAAIRRVLRRHDDDPAAARIAARALAAGLDPDGASSERIMGILDSASGDGSGGHEGAGHGDGDEALLTKAASPDDNDSVEALAATLKAALSRSALDPELAKMSTPGIDGGAWVCLPFELPYDGVDFKGFMRVWYTAGRIGRGRFVADIRCGGQRRLLEISGGGPGPYGIRYCAEDDSERAMFTEAFGKYGRVTVSSLEAGDLADLEGTRKVDADA